MRPCAKAASSLLGCIRQWHWQVEGGDPSPCPRLSLGRPRLDCSVQAWTPQDKKDMGMLERVLQRTTETIRGLETILMCKEKLSELGLFRLQKRKLRGIFSVSANI